MQKVKFLTWFNSLYFYRKDIFSSNSIHSLRRPNLIMEQKMHLKIIWQWLFPNSQIKLLEAFFVKMKFSDDYLDFPIISYNGYYQRRQGCLAGRNRSIYVDSKGNLNACPFCQTNSGNIFSDTFQKDLETLTDKGCPTF